ncbi:MAG: putative maltokinase, partial [Acidimicrobiia bacterium]
NLSRHSQPVAIDLSRFEGIEPVELFGRTRFPAVGANPYMLTIGPHDFYWFGLDRSQAVVEEPSGLPRITVRGELTSVFRARAQLERALVSDIQTRRWFRSKAHQVRGGQMVDRVDVPGTDSMVVFLQIDYVERDPEVYAVPIALAIGLDAERILQDSPGAVIAEVQSGEDMGILYDGAFDPSFPSALIALAAGRRRLRGRSLRLGARRIAGCRTLTREIEGEPVRVGGVEQSNTSLIFGEQLILKLYRKVEPGHNPDLEMGSFLTERAGYAHTPRPRGALNVEIGGEQAAFALVQQYVPNQGDAWTHMSSALGLIFEQVVARREELGPPPGAGHPLDVSDRELDEAIELMGITLIETTLLGQRTGEMHLALASAPDDPVFAPVPLSTLYQRSLYQSARSSIRTSFGLLRRRRSSLSPADAELADLVLGREHDLLADLRSITVEKIEAKRIRIHGDYHLGQVLFTGNDFVVIDFEGEPQRPLSERRIKRLPLRDVAGMLRSYQYTTLMALRVAMEGGFEEPDHAAALGEWADAINRWLSAAFLRGYLGTVEAAGLVPADRRHLRWLLDALWLDKAAYELQYELNNRPDWVEIPLRGLLVASAAYQ